MSDTPFKLVLSGPGVQIDQDLDRATAMQVIAVAVGGDVVPVESSTRSSQSSRKRTGRRKRADGAPKSTGRRRSRSPTLVKDLSLRPKGKRGLVDFADEKRPKTHQQKQAVIVYWLRDEAGLQQGITVDHINTCYQAAGWKRPKNLENSVVVTSMRKAWLDTSDLSNITLTVPGEDLVSHELPAQDK